MKVWASKPSPKEVRIVKTSGRFEYEFWLVSAVKIGGAHKAGTSRITTDMGTTYPNLNEAIVAYLDTMGEADYAEEFRKEAGVSPPTVNLDGMDIVIAGKWLKFCELRGLDPRATPTKALYKLSRAEIALLGMKYEQGSGL
jgi:hypothetical protein